MDLHVYLHADRETERKLDAILFAVKSMLEKEQHMTQEIDDLVLQAQANESAEESALLVINGIAARIDAAIAAAGGLTDADRATLVKLSSDLKATADPLAAAVVANTPAAPAS